MKILFITGYYPPHTSGGGEVSTHYIAQGLKQRGHEVTIICEPFSNADMGEREQGEEVDGVSVHRLHMNLTGKPLFEHRHAREIARVLAQHVSPGKYDIIHAHDFRSALALSELSKLWRLSLQSLVVTVRDYAQISGDTNMILSDGTIPDNPLSFRSMWNSQRVYEASPVRKLFRFWQYSYNTRYRKRAFLSIPNHIYISGAQLDLVERHQDLSNIHTAIIYNPIPPDFISSPTRNGVRGNVLYVGRVEMYKGVRLLLEAWRNVIQNQPHSHLTIVGEGAQRNDYERLVESWGLQYKVSFKGSIPWDRMIRVYDEASIVVLPHLWVEPFGRTVIEGMARGKIVVAANHGGPSEIIQDDMTGLLFEHGSVESLTQRLHDALSMKSYAARELGKNTRTWVAENLTIDMIAQQHEEFYRVTRDS